MAIMMDHRFCGMTAKSVNGMNGNMWFKALLAV
jgi:hypothetical protein